MLVGRLRDARPVCARPPDLMDHVLAHNVMSFMQPSTRRSAVLADWTFADRVWTIPAGRPLLRNSRPMSPWTKGPVARSSVTVVLAARIVTRVPT